MLGRLLLATRHHGLCAATLALCMQVVAAKNPLTKLKALLSTNLALRSGKLDRGAQGGWTCQRLLSSH